MSTNCSVTVYTREGKWKTIYGHWDGGMWWVGPTLAMFYNDQFRAEELVNLGDFSSIDKSLVQPKGHSFTSPVKGHSVFYGRDRKEFRNTQAKIYSSLEEARRNEVGMQEYNYVWNGRNWSVNGMPITPEKFIF